MRETKFRGIDSNGTWYYGDFITDNREYNRTCDKAYILPRWDTLNCPISVDSKSVGQYTGLKDKNKVEIYEGDIVIGGTLIGSMLEMWNKEENKDKEIYIIKYHDASFKTFDKNDNWVAVLNHHVSSKAEKLEVIGNIYENKELIYQ